MYVMQAVLPPVAPPLNELLLLGIPWYVFVMACLIFLLMGIILFILGIQRRNRDKNMQAASGKILLEILPATGGNIPIEWELVDYHNSEARVMEDKSQATFGSPLYADAPKGHAVTRYLLPDEHDYCTGWPIKAPEREQVIVPVYIVHKDFQWPECPHDAKKWDIMRIIQTSATMNSLSKNESTMQALMSPMMAFAEQLRLLVEKMKWLVIAAICAGAAALFGLGNLGATIFYVGKQLSAVAMFLTGK